MLPRITGEFGIVMDPDVKFSDSGKCWVKLRCVAKDRKRDSNGTWSDGDPLFIDVLVFGKEAEHLADSVAKGDSIIVDGVLSPNEWTNAEGVKRTDMRVMANSIGVSLRWNPAKTPAVLAEGGASVAQEVLGATPVTDDNPPF